MTLDLPYYYYLGEYSAKVRQHKKLRSTHTSQPRHCNVSAHEPRRDRLAGAHAHAMPPNRKHLLATPERLRVHVLAARTRSAYSQLAVTGRVNHVLGHAVLTLPSCLVSASRLPLVHLALALPVTKLPRGMESDIRAAVGTQHD
eukprot:CAMPEP_0181199680 /NCGR_PEP_ID=MMETSP1096-20121128/17307_1 /TAXON_ID=156174 ORGANISM="Chrysochromulina ericina, Strain CCMP281" /NCGR_SAMPLE_ID=MMETSP1096 /ASSEMBLY_ACC=CAM_ASM_000453 /LENGTH=143 /DNA_ID=CAMNT_0023289881 /DNA_START=159 /DNA_END=587 /DNA_ORIENTATION=-